MFDVERLMQGFHAELEKTALLSPAASKILTTGGAGMGAGAMLGALAGGGAAGQKGYSRAREQGASRGQAFLAGLGHGVGGILPGAAAGAALGGAGGLAAGAAGRGRLLTDLARTSNTPLASAARFGQRQVHALTGATPTGFLDPEGVRQMRAGAWGARDHLGKVQAALKGAKTPKQVASAQAELKGAVGALRHARAAEEMGLTSLPGYARAMKDHGVGKAIATGVKEQWHGGGTMAKALGFGLPAAAISKELVTPTRQGEDGRLRRAASHAGELAFSAGPLPIAGSLVVAGGLNKAFGKKKAPAQVQPPPSLDPAGGVAVPSEREASERYLGSVGGMA